jgi:hypothetical protein
MASLIWGIAIPFREDPNPEINRQDLLTTVTDYLAEVLPEAAVTIVDSDPSKPFNRAGARNACVRYAESVGWEVVVILDADTLPPADLVLKAVEAARSGGLHQPFRYCVTLNPDLGLTPLTLTPQHLNTRTAHRIWISPGSCYIIRPDIYWRIGGQDEGFIHWGGEDSAFMDTARALGVTLTRHSVDGAMKIAPPNTGVQLHHGDATDRRQHPTYTGTKRRQAIYQRLARNATGMQQWIAERHLPDAEDRWAHDPTQHRRKGQR